MDPNQSLSYITSGLWMPNEEKWYTDSNLINKWTDNNNAAHPQEYKTAVIDYAKNNTVQEPWYYTSYYSQLMDIITPALDKVWLGKDTAENVVKKEIMPKIQPIFDSQSK